MLFRSPAPATVVTPAARPVTPTNGSAPAPSPLERPEPMSTTVDEPAVRTERADAILEPARAHAAPPPPRTVTFDENDDLDVPDFLK